MARRAMLAAFGAALLGSPEAGGHEQAHRQAQGRAEGRYPAVLSCDKLPFTTRPVRDQFTLEISAGRAGYSRRLTSLDAPEAPGGTETGTGALAAGGRLSLTGQGKARGKAQGKAKAVLFESRYAGEVSGTRGLLTGIQSWTHKGKSYDRRCQISIGNGRG